MSSQQTPYPITRNLSEFAVSDTPATTSGTEGSGADYLDYRSHNLQQTHGGGGGSGSGNEGPKSQGKRRSTHCQSGGDEAGETEQNENVDADEQMATLAEGEVARAVERKAGTQSKHRSGRMLKSSRSPHGRGRGEVTLEANEAGLER
ncbi:hypothetical protein MMYC01_201083 [Madurella mycetomatis]|uniref:Uncharacterized protein n=1 Tax=Madurella mycetomatis TaxID=100816 RepID=A0A175WFN0_9PEZI|nr:hypothetical protein MMYC01_201083 [Madurella mycetomatis]